MASCQEIDRTAASSSLAPMPEAKVPPTSAPMLVPTMQSTGMRNLLEHAQHPDVRGALCAAAAEHQSDARPGLRRRCGGSAVGRIGVRGKRGNAHAGQQKPRRVPAEPSAGVSMSSRHWHSPGLREPAYSSRFSSDARSANGVCVLPGVRSPLVVSGVASSWRWCSLS